MKKIIILLLFLLNIFIVFANDKIDYSKYHLQGFFKLGECFKLTETSELCEKQYFNIYDNKIFLRVEGEDTRFIKTPDGIYNLYTNEGSEIKIEVKDGYIEKFDLLSNEKNFIRSEKLIKDDNYCEIAYLISYFDRINKNKQNNKYFTIIDSFNGNEEKFKELNISFVGLLSNEINGKILVAGINYHNIFDLPNEKLELVFKEPTNSEREYFFREGLRLKKDNEKADIIIENCIITYYNKDKEIFTEK